MRTLGKPRRLDKDTDAILVQVLADADAVWSPLRAGDWDRSRPGTTYIRRQQYRRVGLPWTSGTSGEADQKAHQRALHELARTGLARAHRPLGTRTTHAKLTDAGDWPARALAGLPGLDAALATVHKLHELAGNSWVREAPMLTGCPCSDAQYGAEAGAVETMARPALVRQWIAASSDRDGRVSYRLLTAGRRIVAGNLKPETPALPRLSDEAAELYATRIRTAFELLHTPIPGNRDIGMIPLPVSMPSTGDRP